MNLEDSINKHFNELMEEYDIPPEVIKEWIEECTKCIKGGRTFCIKIPENPDPIKELPEFPKLQRFRKDLL